MLIINIRKKCLILAGLIIAVLILCSFIYKTGKSQEVPAPETSPQEPPPHGEFLSWEQVDQLFPRYSCATIIDYKTRLRFDVQRRGGTYHADVQPLDAKDTAVMKQLFNHQWTWQRRPVILQLPGGQRVAASMNGMPHGAGNIRGNNFNGHFCIHFKDSKTHATRTVNMAHQIMVWQAAGVVNEQLARATPSRVIEIFMAAVDQGEITMVKKVIDNQAREARILLDRVKTVEKIKLDIMEDTGEGNFSIEVRVVYKDSDREYIKKGEIYINSNRKISPATMLPLLEKE